MTFIDGNKKFIAQKGSIQVFDIETKERLWTISDVYKDREPTENDIENIVKFYSVLEKRADEIYDSEEE